MFMFHLSGLDASGYGSYVLSGVSSQEQFMPPLTGNSPALRPIPVSKYKGSLHCRISCRNLLEKVLLPAHIVLGVTCPMSSLPDVSQHSGSHDPGVVGEHLLK